MMSSGVIANVQSIRFGTRLMRRRPPFGGASESIESLRQVLLSAPGVSGVLSIESHYKGGLVAVMDFDRSAAEQFIDHIEAAGWMCVF